MDKKEFIAAIIAQKEQELETWKTETGTLNDAKDIDEEDVQDIDELSQQDEATELSDFSQSRLDQAQAALSLLKTYSTENMDTVGKGALVDVGDRYLFIGPSLPNMEAGGKTVSFVSEDAPAYENMQGLKKGDTFKLGDKNVTISSII